MAGYKLPHALARALGFLLSSGSMFSLARRLPRVFDKRHVLLQDVL
eukprot:CAMPEP_0113700526 /NCGR_PEP_ID=MMETSP0038_2-20120614/24015_1 /TAXON_ID=2898 /ORGANISM="Cryptomonas paramecium" /LENGTH=45 /DNA_ID=CAMNT_0000624211 /DNA_START=512 /DNA_END=645 /DNA_ORIENTATION=+ /assembly_acc=CAM_ASM_000170